MKGSLTGWTSVTSCKGKVILQKFDLFAHPDYNPGLDGAQQQERAETASTVSTPDRKSHPPSQVFEQEAFDPVRPDCYLSSRT